MYSPLTLPFLGLLGLALIFLLAMLEIGVIETAYLREPSYRRTGRYPTDP
jgi:hypothetical protein